MSRIVLPAEPLSDGPTSLRPWRDSDASDLVRACQDPEISRWTRVPYPYGDNDARAYLLYRHDGLAAGTLAPFVIVRTDDDCLLGAISLLRFAWSDRRAEVGYWLAREARGQGHATRALGLICRWGIEELGLERIDLLAATENPGSQKVAERAGFAREAVLRAYLRGRDGQQDMVAFGLLAVTPARSG